MPDDLVFLMGKFEAHLPADLRYARNHTWCRHAHGRLRFAFTSYAVRLVEDAYFLDWQGDTVEEFQQIGADEKDKAVSDLLAAIFGSISVLKYGAPGRPLAVKLDKVRAGWGYQMEGDEEATITVAEYHQYLAANWEK